MFKRTFLVAVLWTIASSTIVLAQINDKLGLLIPTLYGPGGLTVDSVKPIPPNNELHTGHFNGSFQERFTQFNVALASTLSALPLPSPASGFTYSYDPASGGYTLSTQSFGPILAERAETIGRRKFSFGLSYQRFSFDHIEGIDLNNVPAVFTHDEPTPPPSGRADVITTINSIKATFDQYTFLYTSGLTDWLDFSMAFPMVTADLRVVSDATIQRIGTGSDTAVHFFATGSDLNNPANQGSQKEFVRSGRRNGIGDIVIRLKGRLHKWERAGLALGMDFRLPSGDAENLLGTGAVGFKPFVAYSYRFKRFSPHLNLGYQWNGKSILAGGFETVTLAEKTIPGVGNQPISEVRFGSKKSLPDQFLYIVGVDYGLTSRLSLAFDFVGQRVTASPRLQTTTFTALDNVTTFRDLTFTSGAFNQTNGAAGLKVNPFRSLLVNFNLLFKLDDNGLRDKLTPLVGVTYTF